MPHWAVCNIQVAERHPEASMETYGNIWKRFQVLSQVPKDVPGTGSPSGGSPAVSPESGSLGGCRSLGRPRDGPIGTGHQRLTAKWTSMLSLYCHILSMSIYVYTSYFQIFKTDGWTCAISMSCELVRRDCFPNTWIPITWPDWMVTSLTEAISVVSCGFYFPILTLAMKPGPRPTGRPNISLGFRWNTEARKDKLKFWRAMAWENSKPKLGPIPRWFLTTALQWCWLMPTATGCTEVCSLSLKKKRQPCSWSEPGTHTPSGTRPA